MKGLAFILIVNSLFLFAISCKDQPEHYPPEIEKNLLLAKNNRPELEKAIRYFQQHGDSLKLQAIYFLIANMDIHRSVTYYWADTLGHKVEYNEFDYPDFKSAVEAIDSLKQQIQGLHFQDTVIEDISSVSAQFLIDNVNQAVDVWRLSPYKDIPFQDFCEYILPYRVTTEPLDNWRQRYYERYRWLGDSLKNKPLKHVLGYAAIDFGFWFDFNYGKNTREASLSRLGALQLLFRKQGACEDVAALETFSLRSQGIPVSYNIIPLWGTSFGAHFLNTVFDPEMKPLRFDVTRNPTVGHIPEREPAKVIRVTYSRQPDALASLIPQANIPPCFLRTPNQTDITSEYWETTDISCALFPPEQTQERADTIVYACMFSKGRWLPVWWGKAVNDTVTFTGMPKGTVILPAYYKYRKMIPAGFPFANGYNHKLSLIPDTLHKRTITLYKQEHYLIFRPGKKYRLYYWGNGWRFIAEQTAGDQPEKLIFENVPRNALMLLIPEYTERKERPFIVTEDGIRHWW